MVCLFCGVEFGAERVQFSNLGSSTWIYCLFKGVGDGDAVGVSSLKGSVTFCFPSSLNPKKNQHFQLGLELGIYIHTHTFNSFLFLSLFQLHVHLLPTIVFLYHVHSLAWKLKRKHSLYICNPHQPRFIEYCCLSQGNQTQGNQIILFVQQLCEKVLKNHQLI